ncbi:MULTISPECIES: hypothetical protein [unclassified Pseudomonas]|uniref:hypothetical protein n=1 Tax=unclassified Pseudomonas TaxID=196821 RepID=UPI00244B6CE7|nr:MULTISPECIES: hypothetical protein [unclassified Pseudomonas]MDG9922170.1 hypothetical protein [Pseudomonas sp. GD04045]MDH0033737.1 hypothetical protein [Pseudomonas sp. GD04019]
MKKISLILAGLMVSGLASAVQIDNSGEAVTMQDCDLLNEDVAVNLTNGVQAGVQCNANAIAISACHTGGRRTTRTVDVTTCDTATPPVCTTAPAPVTGPAMPTASTLAGTVISQYPGGGDCTAATAETNAGRVENLPAVTP